LFTHPLSALVHLIHPPVADDYDPSCSDSVRAALEAFYEPLNDKLRQFIEEKSIPTVMKSINGQGTHGIVNGEAFPF
jgi:hypothetical protein